ncbi:MAG TPA: cysteine desulfurase [Candidatus Obscuribacterales bacterium]
MLNAEILRADFPILKQEINGFSLVYLDNAATTQKPRQVIEAIVSYYQSECANVHRGVHSLSQRATDHFEQVRRQVAAFVNAPAPEAVIFTKGTTDGINLVMQSWASSNLVPGANILLSQTEHHSNFVPWLMLAKSLGVELRLLPVALDGTFILDDLERLVDEKTALVAIQQMSNVTGAIHDLAPIVRAARTVGAKILVDGAQSVPHLSVDFQAMDIDFLVFSAHKMLGPSGVGVLVSRPEILEAMPPFMGGGAMIKEVWEDRFSWGDLPYRFEAGTPNIEGVIGFGAALSYLEAVGMANIHAHEQLLLTHALEQLKELEDIQIYGPADLDCRGGILSFNLRGLHAQDVGELLDQQGIAIRTGHHCCQPLMRHYGISGMARASFYLYNTPTEVDALVKGLKRAQRLIARAARR